MQICILLTFFTLMSAVTNAPIGKDSEATILKYDYQLKEDGYFFTYTTSNGITREENAVLSRDSKAQDDGDQILRIKGFYSYNDEDNKLHRVDYVANENGYKILGEVPSASISTSISQETQYIEQKGISSAALASLSGS